MKQHKQRFIAFVLAVLQMMTLISPAGIAAAETVASPGYNATTDRGDMYYVQIDASSDVLNALASEGYYVVVRQENNGTVSYAARPIGNSVFEGFEEKDFKANDNGDFAGISSNANNYTVFVAKLSNYASSPYSSANNAYGEMIPSGTIEVNGTPYTYSNGNTKVSVAGMMKARSAEAVLSTSLNNHDKNTNRIKIKLTNANGETLRGQVNLGGNQRKLVVIGRIIKNDVSYYYAREIGNYEENLDLPLQEFKNKNTQNSTRFDVGDQVDFKLCILENNFAILPAGYVFPNHRAQGM